MIPRTALWSRYEKYTNLNILGRSYRQFCLPACLILEFCSIFWKVYKLFIKIEPVDYKIQHKMLQTCINIKKCTLVQALRLCTGHKARKGSRGITLLFLDHGTRRRWEVSVTPQPLFTPGKTRYPLYRRLGGTQGRSGQVRKISLPPQGFEPGPSSP